MEYTVPQSHKELLQAVLKELITARDTEATFKEYEPPSEIKPDLDGFGRPIALGGTTDPR